MAPRAHGPGERVQVSSAGSEPSDRVHPLAVRAMTEIGLDMLIYVWWEATG